MSYDEHLISMAGGDGDELDQIQRRADAATAGPWFQHQDWIDMGVPDASHTISDDPKPYGKFIASVGLHYDVKHGNADFIAHARTDIPALLAMVRELEGKLAGAKADALREAAERFKTRSDTFHNTMKEMAESREYGVEDIVRYGAYSAEANSAATWLRTRAALTATEATP